MQAYNSFGQYFLVPAIANEDMTSIGPMLDYCIEKRELYIKDAWNVGKNDLEGTAIHKNDDPIIPKDIANPPILDLLRIKRGDG